MASDKDTRSLVCSRCWSKVFDTADFQGVCLQSGDFKNGKTGMRYTTTVNAINDSVAKGCNWCSLLQSFTSRVAGPTTLQESLAIYLCSVDRDICTPRGNNTFYLSIDRNLDGRWVGGWSLMLGAFTHADDEAADVVTARELRSDVRPSQFRGQVVKWLKDCADHDCCGAQKETLLPTRVIEVNPAETNGVPRLLISKGQRGKYAALSYCWGAKPSCVLNASNLNNYIRRLDCELLPQSIRDAIEVSRAISMPYLWIDSLCIVQDSEEDKAKEIALMEQIFRSSLVTIVAACANDVTRGFLYQRAPPAKSYCIPFRVGSGQFGKVHLQDLCCDIEYDETWEPINSRGWTLQEQLIPDRFLVFASHTLQWRCKAGVENFGGSLHFPDRSDEEKLSNTLFSLSRPTPGKEEALSRWLRIVSIYSRRVTSLSDDKLPALAAIAEEFMCSLGPKYFAGLWEYSLLWQLTWTTFFPYRRDDDDLRISKPLKYRAPSWSWASVDGRIDHPIEEAESEIFNCELVHCVTTLKKASHPLGEVSEGYLTLKAVIRYAWFVPATRNILWLAENDQSLAAAETQYFATRKEDESEDSDDDLSVPEQDPDLLECQLDISDTLPPIFVACMPVVALDEFCRGLLLAPLEDGNFIRIGSFTRISKSSFDNLIPIKITII